MSLETTILVVDDEIEMRIFYKNPRKMRFKVELAHNVETALNKLFVSS